MSEPVTACPTCPEGWRPLDKEHCAECYPAWIDAAALQAAHEIVALSESWPYARKKAAIQVIVAREMMRAGKQGGALPKGEAR
jgi:hypothetical protein